MRINRLAAAGLGALGFALAWMPGALSADAATTAGGVTRAPSQSAEVAPYSRHPAETRPYAVCPPPTERRTSCLAAVVPTEGGEPVVGPSLEGSGMLGGFSPADLRSAYGLPGVGGTGKTIAITIAYGDPLAEADLATYRSHYGLAPCTTANGCFKKLNQDGEAGNYPEPKTDWALETSLDLDMVSAACPSCHIVLVEADSNQFEDMAAAVDRAAEQGVTAISDSWASQEASGEADEDHHFAHPGIPVLFATGDSGYGVAYPAASPDVIAVGGTSLSKSGSSRGWSETVWSGAGSGCSAYEPKPAWQHDDGCSNRTVADVSAVSDPQTPVSVYDSFASPGWTLLGGTSVATPLVAGVEALSSNAFREAGPSGFARAGNGGGLFDVTEGENGPCGVESDHGFDATYLCQGGAGYDGPSGWGSPLGPLSLPVAVTEGATASSTAEATLHGSVDPEGLPTEYRFEYGETTAYGHSAPIPDQSVGSSSGYVAVSQAIEGLHSQTPYHYRIAASNSAGTFHGVDRVFGTTPPSVSTGAATEIHAFDAHLNAKVNPEGLATSYYFEYGLSTSYDYKAPAVAQAVGGGVTDVAVSSFVYGLIPGKTYHFRVVARNSAGKTEGADRFLITDQSHWRAETLPQPPESGEGHEAFGVSCTEPDDCVAVGGNWSLEVHTRVTLAERWDGSTWSVMDTPNPPGLDDGWEHDWYAVLTGVSCASPTDCLAVGQYRDSGEVVKPLAERWDGSQWSRLSIGLPGGATAAALQGVSCSSATACTAVGYSEDASEAVKSLAEIWEGSSWTVEPTPSPSGSPPASWLEGVSCSSAAACTAVGTYETSFGTERTLAERWEGGEWAIQTTQNPPGSEAWNELRSVSCPSATACVAVGRHVQKSGTDFTPTALVERWDGTEWTTQSIPQPPQNEGNALFGVSCASPTACTAVGTNTVIGAAASYAEVFGERWDGAAWSILGMVGLSYPIGWWHERWLYGVSCAEAEGCNAVGAGLAAPEGQLAPFEAIGEHEVQPPYAVFSRTPNAPSKGDVVGFDASASVDPGRTIEAYEWDFGDGATATGSTTSHAYAHAGDYAATLKVTDDHGRSGEISHLVSIAEAPPQPAFTFQPTSPTATEEVAFDASSSHDPDGTLEAYEWDFGDGSHGGGATPSHTYSHAGTYHVSLRVTDDEGTSAAASHSVVVSDAPPLAAFTADPPSSTATQTVAFDASGSSDPDGTIEAYVWDFGDGATATGLTASHTYAHAGEYAVTLKVTDDEGGTGQASHPIDVAGAAPVAAFAVSTASPTAGRPVAFDGSASIDPDGAVGTYGWDFGDGGQGGGVRPSHVFASAGLYPVTLKVIDEEGKTAEVAHLVAVAPAPIPAGTLDVRRISAGCNGRLVLLLRAPGAGRLGAVATASVMAPRLPGRRRAPGRARKCHTGRAARASDRAGRRPFSYGSSSAVARARGDVRLTIAPGGSALRALRRSGRLRVGISITFEPRGGETQTVHRTLVVHP